MTKLTNAKTVTAVLQCDNKDFKCIIEIDGGSQLYFKGPHGIEMFFNMIDMFFIDGDDYEQKKVIQ